MIQALPIASMSPVRSIPTSVPAPCYLHVNPNQSHSATSISPLSTPSPSASYLLRVLDGQQSVAPLFILPCMVGSTAELSTFPLLFHERMIRWLVITRISRQCIWWNFEHFCDCLESSPAIPYFLILKNVALDGWFSSLSLKSEITPCPRKDHATMWSYDCFCLILRKACEDRIHL